MLLDAAANAAMKAIFQTGSSVTPFKYAALAGGNGSTALSSALSTASPITSLPVTALLVGSSISNGQPILLQSGTNTQVVYATASAPAGSTSVNVASVPNGTNGFTPNFAYPIGTFVVPQPQASDNPTALTGALYLAVPSGSILTNDGAVAGSPLYSGYGNRKIAFNPLTWTNGASSFTFTEIWFTTVNPVTGVGQCGIHLCVPQTTIAASATYGPASIVEKY